ncbi:flavin reductase family protein [Amycolatopsis jejuensis]|uniref:flavin reductase family protein n=1 Tax=Amycolatopsis jejuensis TaxID=330084 RepID=UPI00052684F9|nr:flavin reductase family protein [Amycolatopsis jejuensis]
MSELPTQSVPVDDQLVADLAPAQLRHLFGAFPSGVTALAALVDGQPVGLAASSFTSVSLDPPLVSVCVAHTSTTWPHLGTAAHLGLSVLSDDQSDFCRQLAAKTGDRFAGVPWCATSTGAVLLGEASAWLDCTVEQLIEAGDHDIVLLRVHTHRVHPDPDRAPLVFHASQFRRLRCL